MEIKDYNLAVMELNHFQRVLALRILDLMSKYETMDDILKGVEKEDAKEYADLALQLTDSLVDLVEQSYGAIRLYRYEIKKNRKLFK